MRTNHLYLIKSIEPVDWDCAIGFVVDAPSHDAAFDATVGRWGDMAPTRDDVTIEYIGESANLHGTRIILRSFKNG